MAGGSWTVRTRDGARVRLRSTSAPIGIDVTAPVAGGELVVGGPEGARFTLRLALDQLRTGNFLLQAAARRLVSRGGGQVLRYDGAGSAGPPVRVSGRAVAGTIDVALDLELTPVGGAGAGAFGGEVDVAGAASLGPVDLPLPGFGRIDDFRFDVTARLTLDAAPPTPLPASPPPPPPPPPPSAR